MGHEDLQLFHHWYRFLDWLLNTTEKFPKKVRFTLSTRLDNLALDILENIIEAAYTRQKITLLRKTNLKVEKMRVMLRICHDRNFLSTRSFEHSIKELYQAGLMLGGWIKDQKNR
jgi:hypothetical protein